MASINTRENTLLNEKYRPVDLDNYVGNAHLKATLAKQLAQNDIQNYLFYGPAGTGKTTLAKLIISNLECDSLYINASDERGIETIRDKVTGFASVASIKPIKVVILDEADFLTIQAQASLRNVIETFSRTTRFILTCNFVERIIDPLQSRCQTFKIVPPTKKEVAIHVAGICDKENIGYELPDIGHLVSKYYPDIRKILNTLQSSVIEGKVELDDSLLVSSNYMSSVLEGLKNNDFKAIRQTIADSGVDDFDELFRFLYENSTEFMPNKEGTAAILINEHLYKANFRIDKEINLMSLIQNLINNK
tara:strand:- start:17390 stop:18307 length:918 start_codon:yes stop_codon:yes gene_type:complete